MNLARVNSNNRREIKIKSRNKGAIKAALLEVARNYVYSATINNVVVERHSRHARGFSCRIKGDPYSSYKIWAYTTRTYYGISHPDYKPDNWTDIINMLRKAYPSTK